MTSPLVSIVIPCYNASQFIEETVESIKQQSYHPIEIIVVDDGSTDNSLSILQNIDNIVVISQSNAGVSTARNKGYEISNGTYIGFVDADDWLYPNTIADKVSALTRSNAHIAYGTAHVTNQFLEETGVILEGAKENTLEALLNYAPPAIPCPSNALISREALTSAGLFDETLSTSADYDMWLRICQNFDAIHTRTKGIKYRQHGENMFSNLELQLHDMEIIFEKHRNLNMKKVKKKFYNSIAKSYILKGEFTKSMKYFKMAF